jgi:ketosteroid isomerase-like protein
MSENLDLVRSIYADWERGDLSRADWAHPEIEFVIADGPEPGRWSGFAGMAQGTKGLLGAFEDYRVEADEYRELDGGRVLVLVHDRGRGKASGLDIGHITGERAMVFHIREGRVTQFVLYWDRDRALADLGLEE